MFGKGLTRRAALAGLVAAPVVRTARAEDLLKASVALLRLSSSGPVFIAQEKGWFKDAGLDLAIKDFTAAAQPPLAVVSGDADFGMTAFTAGFYNLAAKGGVKVIAAQSAEKPGYPLVAIAVTKAAWDAGIRSIKDFAGKRIGMTTAGSSMHYSIEIVARKHGIDPKTITMVPLNSLPNMAAAFKGGNVDGALFPVTTWRQVEADSGGHLIAWVGDETPWQLGGVFTAPKTITERRPVVEKFIAGYQRGADRLQRGVRQARERQDRSGAGLRRSAEDPGDGGEAITAARVGRPALHRSDGPARRRRHLQAGRVVEGARPGRA